MRGEQREVREKVWVGDGLSAPLLPSLPHASPTVHLSWAEHQLVQEGDGSQEAGVMF